MSDVPGAISKREIDAFDRHFHEHPLVSAHARNPRAETQRISDLVSAADFQRTGLYNEYYRPIRIDHPGYGPRDAFYQGVGRASALSTCNHWVADRLRLAGVKASLWAPFAQGLVWRYRRAGA